MDNYKQKLSYSAVIQKTH